MDGCCVGRKRERGKMSVIVVCVVFQAEDGIRDLVRSRGLGDVYKRQAIRVYSGAKAGKRNAIRMNIFSMATCSCLQMKFLSLIHI